MDEVEEVLQSVLADYVQISSELVSVEIELMNLISQIAE